MLTNALRQLCQVEYDPKGLMLYNTDRTIALRLLNNSAICTVFANHRAEQLQVQFSRSRPDKVEILLPTSPSAYIRVEGAKVEVQIYDPLIFKATGGVVT
jgi:hypothetical protein